MNSGCKQCGYCHLEIHHSPYYVEGLCSSCAFKAEIIYAIWTDSPFYPNRHNYLPPHGRDKASKELEKILDYNGKKIKCTYCKKKHPLTTLISGHPDYHGGLCPNCDKNFIREYRENLENVKLKEENKNGRK